VIEIDARYKVVKQLGSGSMGVVYLAHDVFLDRAVAVKVIDPVHASDPMTTERFKKEAQALAKIKHPNVVQIYAFGPHERSFFFAMEYVAGRSLEAAIDAGDTVDVAGNIPILHAVASGLAAVHALKLVHRDVKPSNIVVEGETGRPVLIDFGLARRRSASNPRLSITGGTPMYMAPEQAADPNGTNVTFRADIYALACSAFELFTGGPVFDGKDIFEIMLGHLKRPAPAISTRRPDLAMFDAVFARALAKDPLARHDSAPAFVAELEEAFAREAQSKRDTVARPSSIRRTSNPEDRILVLARDEGLVRQMSRVTKRALSSASREADIEQVASAGDLVLAFARERASIVLVDEESSEIHAGELVRQLRDLSGGRSASILLVSREWQALRPMLGVLGVRDVLPKPLVVQMLAAAVERIVARRSIPELDSGT
jgi:serine/threonine protein kinase